MPFDPRRTVILSQRVPYHVDPEPTPTLPSSPSPVAAAPALPQPQPAPRRQLPDGALWALTVALLALALAASLLR